MKKALIKSEKKNKSNGCFENVQGRAFKLRGCFENVQGRAFKLRSRKNGRKKEMVTGAKPNTFCHTYRLVMKAMSWGLKNHHLKKKQ